MDKTIEYTTIDEQLSMLKARNLIINDDDFAAEQLKKFGYYNIINSYKSPYLIEKNGKKLYKDNTSFEQIFSLFTFDHNLRNAIMSAMLALEEHIKAAAAEVIASSYGTDQNTYLQWKNYRDRKVSHSRFGLKGILETLQKNCFSDKDPIKYYRETYGIIPPWILFKGTYFSTMINYIKVFKNKEKSQFAKLMFECSDELSNSREVKTLLSDTLSICLEYRNLAAHGGRVYNYTPNSNLGVTDFSSVSTLRPLVYDLPKKRGLSLLLNLLDLFPYKQPFDIIDNALTSELNRHLNQFEQDLDFLGDTLNLIIFSEREDAIFIDGIEYPIKARKQSGFSGLLITDMPDALKEKWIKRSEQ